MAWLTTAERISLAAVCVRHACDITGRRPFCWERLYRELLTACAAPSLPLFRRGCEQPLRPELAAALGSRMLPELAEGADAHPNGWL